MPDVENVIALLERYVRIPNLAGAENYGAKIVDMPAPLITDAIALLKAQEPVKPIVTDGTRYILCGNCKQPLCRTSDNYLPSYCEECGRPVKWDG